jgi:hypothetical protein
VNTHTEKIVTLNDDFTDHLTDPTALLDDGAPFAILVQEGKRTLYRRVLRRLRRRLKRQAKSNGGWMPLGYQAAQITDNDATKGLAIIWDAATAPLVAGPSYEVLVEPHGAAMLPRGILSIVVDHPEWGETVLATAHRPPLRYARLWAEFDRNLQTWVRIHRDLPILLGMDTNTTRLADLAKRVGLQVAGKRIDAVMAHGFHLGRPRSLKRRNSDHRPVAVDATR